MFLFVYVLMSFARGAMGWSVICDFGRVYSDRQLNSDSHLVCFIVQLLE